MKNEIKGKTKENFISKYNEINKHLLIISDHLFERLLYNPKSSDLISLYLFYRSKAKIDSENFNWTNVTVEYTAKRLGMSKDRVRKAKKKLKDMGIINFGAKLAKNGRFTGYIIEINM